MSFTERLKELRIDNKLTQKELSLSLGLSANCVCEWEKGRSEPNIETIILLSNRFQVSVDYLLGREDDFGNIVIKNNASFAVSDAEKKHLTNLRRLKPQTQQYIFGLVENLALSG